MKSLFDVLADVADTRADSFCEDVPWQLRFCMLRVALIASTVFNLRRRMDCRTVMLHKKVPSGEPKLIFFCPAGRKTKISRLRIFLFRGDVSVFGVVIHIARHSIGIKNTTHNVVLHYSLAN